ncbi:molecular chaperone Skp [Sodalis endosymbiont of Henestaris halophilus]|uniref:molecular chaperone Skp n=1 Tax=Sodalis endosymbiont of Henestaris halophilus TaxID=1929246 RepID=UPI000BC06779|nr:molecular chaperone Skp [Sodalis endosymbiont of Henestaris halophilus]SNC58317.1 Chaperone protein Skp precursor [Sodalis endosymbiont of Henestaris halophilus]
MKKWLYAAGLGLTLTTAFAQAADKIAVVNVSNVFQNSPQLAAIIQQLEYEFKDRANELQSMERDLQAKIQLLQRDGSTMKASELSSLEKLVMDQRNIFSNKAQAFEQDNRRRNNEERKKILSRIQDAVKIVANEKGYDIVIDSTTVAYANSTKDITDDVMKQVK